MPDPAPFPTPAAPESSTPPSSEVKAHIEDVADRLSSPEFSDDPAFDNHRRLLREARASANGSGGDIAQVNRTLGQLAAVYVEDRIREPARVRAAAVSAAADAVAEHRNACVAPDVVAAVQTTVRELSDQLSAIQRDGIKRRPPSALTLKVGDKSLDASGAVAVAIVAALFWLGILYMRGRVSDDVRAQVRALASQSLASPALHAAPAAADEDAVDSAAAPCYDSVRRPHPAPAPALAATRAP